MVTQLTLNIEKMDLEKDTKSAQIMKKILMLQNERNQNNSTGITAYRVVPRYDVYSVGWS